MKILYPCSWLNPQTGIGGFFVEQGDILLKYHDVRQLHYVVFIHLPLFSAVKTVLFKGLVKTEFDGRLIFSTTVPLWKKENWFYVKLIKLFLYIQWKREIEQYDVIHAQSLMPAGIYSYYLANKYRKPLFITEHNQLNLLGTKLSRKTIFKALNYCSCRFVVSRDLIRQFASNGLFIEFKLIYNPLHSAFYHNTVKSRKLKDKIVILHSGAYTHVKHQDALFRLLKRIEKETYYEVDLLWAGYNSWGVDRHSELTNRIEWYGFSSRISISLYPVMDKKELVQLYEKADMYICTSICETFGLASLEALALGIPLLTTDNGGAREFAEVSNSVIVPVCSDDALFEGFTRLIELIPTWKNEEIARNIRERFSPELFTEKLVSAYKNSLENRYDSSY